jgi:7-carboxy-7-deazaguanine synthase
MLPVVESFTSIQGEGPRAGRLCTFIRFGGCNLSCGFAGGWVCDSSYTWDSRSYDLKAETTRMTVDEIVNLVDTDINEVVLTGGEPLIHQKNPEWNDLIRRLRKRDIFVAIETNGTITPNETMQTFVGHFSISPKLSNTTHRRGQSPRLAVWPDRIKHQRTCLKFVVDSNESVMEALALAEANGWPRWNVWLMPEGTSEDTLSLRFGSLVELAIKERVNVSHRLHILAFGDSRGT